MKIIFLDIDGVLNHSETRHICFGMMGIEQDKIRILKDIIRATGAKIVLSSSWADYINMNGPNHTPTGDYLQILLKANMIDIHDIIDTELDRGEAIAAYVKQHKPESWVVLDDDVFDDFKENGIIPHLIKTKFYSQGLTEDLAEKAIKMLQNC